MMQLTLNNLRYYWRTHVGVLLGVILSSAVLTGALLVGDSVRGSLRRQALERLGPYTHALEMPHALFSARLGELLDAEALLRLDGMALNEAGLQVNRVQVLGGILEPEADSGVLLNEALARALGVSAGDMVSLRLEKPGLLPRDAPLAGQRADAMVRGRFRVERIVSGAEFGNFSLRANQVAPYNAFVSRAWLADRMELAGRANLMMATGARVLAAGWVAEDFGLRFREHEGVVQLESERVYLEAEVARAAMSIEGAAGSLTYLVNSISCGERATPYSFVTAGGMVAEPGHSEGIIINEWLATELEASVGDAVTLRYYELLPSNEYVERERSFEVTAVAAMEALTLERALAPLFPGLTDVDRCAEWDAGFPLEAEALEDAANEAYWEQYRQTPKAMISLATGQSIWSNRFGELTAVRWEGRELADIRGAFQAAFSPEVAGFVFRPVRAEAEAAVEQALDFGQLFVGISFFLIVAALMLTGLLFVFGVQKRSEELGILMAMGWRTKQIRRLVMREGSLVALAGSLVGGLLGIGYTELLIWGLSSEWSGAVAQASIACFVSVKTVLTGMGVSFLCANGAMLLSIRKGLKQEPRALLCGGGEQEDVQVGGARGEALVAVLAVVGAGVLVAGALGGFFASVTIPFFGAGALLLIAGILGAGLGLRYARQRGGLWGLALRNAMRRRGRSLAVIGLLASGCFLVFAVASMQEDLSLHAAERGSGTGGFAFYAESVLPIQDDVGGVRLRFREGDDASCLNLNRAQEPRLVGVDGSEMAGLGAFGTGVWDLLALELPDGMVPGLVGDMDTAMWGLEAKVGPEKGDVLVYPAEGGRELRVKLVGALPMRLSVFQGAVLIPERSFVAAFPREGYRLFLLEGEREDLKGSLMQAYSRFGLEVVSTLERLRAFYTVETTYLVMFLVLGVMGLAVGSLGMGVVVLRNVQDRRSEWAILRAVGYDSAAVKKVLWLEHALLFGLGLGVGTMASAVAMVPAIGLSGSTVSLARMSGLFLLVVLCGLISLSGAVAVALRGELMDGLRSE